ncbi:MAG TPA: hypothetical protein VHX14_10660 [Thermoanaerobaculia bacterium]|jgi:uncharacterized membrane protein (DUF485 family)|nr:hypothetical protein [Thermoanaerobaculia bacterium]
MSDDNISDSGNRPFASWPGLKQERTPAPASHIETSAPALPPTSVPLTLPELRFVLESKLVAEQPPETSDGSSPDGLPPSRYEHGLWRAGWTDGRIGETPDPQLHLVASQGKLTRALRTAEAKKQLAAAESDAQHKRFIAEQRQKEWDDISTEHNHVVDDQRRNAVGYSKLLAWIYLLFGIGIFIADMPLSLKVAPALGVSTRQSPSNGGPPVSADNLSQLLYNLDTLWEPAAVAVGIAALTIAFKILIDKLQKPRRYETMLSKALLFLLLAAIFSAMIYAFVLIGQARAAHAGAGANVNRAWLFTILAIMFPLVCGYCFSMARAAFQNVAHYDLVTKQRAEAWVSHTEAHLAMKQADAAATGASEELKSIEGDHVEEEFLKNLYLHGYQRGRCVPETIDQQASLYDRCEALVHHWLANLQQSDHEAAERRL